VFYGLITIVSIDLLAFFVSKNERSPLKNLSFNKMLLIWNIDSIYILLIFRYFQNDFLFIIVLVSITLLIILGLFLLARTRIISVDIVIAIQTIGMIITVLFLLAMMIIFGLLVLTSDVGIDTRITLWCKSVLNVFKLVFGE
jgi:hypothetical protein